MQQTDFINNVEKFYAQLSCGISTLKLVCDAVDEQRITLNNCGDALDVIHTYLQNTSEVLLASIVAYDSAE